MKKLFVYLTLSILGLMVSSFNVYAAPTITFTNDVATGPVTSDTISITVSGTSGATQFRYAFSPDTNCVNDSYTGGNSFTSGGIFTITNTTNNGNYICARVNDNSGSNDQQIH